MTTFLTADTHFGHALMLTAHKRPFSSTAEMNEALIEAWNSAVQGDDTVWHLGDFAMKLDAAEVSDIWYRLNGRKHLILGNHDYAKDGTVLPALARLPWASISAAAQLNHQNHRIHLSHYAHWVWNQSHRGSLHAFGHDHGRLAGLPGSIDVGVDAQGLAPIPVEEFIRQAEDSIIYAENQVSYLIDGLADRMELYREQATRILAQRLSSNAT